MRFRIKSWIAAWNVCASSSPVCNWYPDQCRCPVLPAVFWPVGRGSSKPMSDLYPFLLIPIFDDRPWGVRDLRPIYTKIVKEPIGESWLTWSDSCIANGPFAGRTLGEIAREYRRELVGSAAVYEDRFPLLVKFLFSAEKLSVQVHPDDAGAQRVGQPYGKTECWYVLRAEPGAQVALGLRPGTTLVEFENSILENRVEELLNWISVY